jgi:hypothetical protein
MHSPARGYGKMWEEGWCLQVLMHVRSYWPDVCPVSLIFT